MVQKIQKNSITLMGLSLLLMVMLTAGVIAGQSSVDNPTFSASYKTTVEPFDLKANSSSLLDMALNSEQFKESLATEKTVPPLVLASLPDDFAAVQDPRKRQDLFLKALLPIVLIENRRISEQRELAKLLLEGEQPAEGSAMSQWLKNLARKLRVRGDINKPDVASRILNRLDIIPPDLALAQAAIETGWGTSRFALEGNSLFGQWTFKSDQGLIPSQRDNDATHFVASFPDLRASVRAYMRNLNTGRAYREFREARAKLRAEGKEPVANELVKHLHRYSQRGEEYTAELQRLLKNRRIAGLSNTSLGKVNHNLVIASID